MSYQEFINYNEEAKINNPNEVRFITKVVALALPRAAMIYLKNTPTDIFVLMPELVKNIKEHSIWLANPEQLEQWGGFR